ncbi:protein of unknown function [Pseudoxanthomonas sp. GM95]|uniref:DUF4259 domain-containing protein n=1 Tax=Pseudoxanthomonas sp. GM95 TaxID=1881043 RepID=UPI0008C8B34B|nr:DUF4259 domain-containing protein [Pseudoxanthomonas sp. GM95]SEL51832.1 protein of unknown function [Pseudoxanthomonas sp. GM95]
MGAWGHGSFENDDAADFIADVVDGNDLNVVGEALAAVLAAGDALEAPEACYGLAAAEVVAAAIGRPTAAAQADEELTEWLARTRPAASDDLVQLALAALARIVGEGSELKELWDEVDETAAWEATVTEIKTRLKG